VKRALLVLALASTASAESIVITEPGDEFTKSEKKLGFRLGGGSLPIEHYSVGGAFVTLGLEHRVAESTRFMAEYEWMWLHITYDDPMRETPPGMGHRTHAGVRTTLAAKPKGGEFRFYADAELGAGLGYYDVLPGGVRVLPHAFLGLRGGYQLNFGKRRASQFFETEISVRAIVVEYGIGFGGGLGFYWGD
jgi:hypothetical protein